MKICVVAGSKTQAISSAIAKNKKVEIEPIIMYKKVDELIKQILSVGISFLTTVDCVYVLDTAFKGANDVDVRKKELLQLQDVLNTKGFDKKVYYMTKDMNLFKAMSSEKDINNNFIYKNLIILPYSSTLVLVDVTDTLLGKNDTASRALHHPDFGRSLIKTQESLVKDELTPEREYGDDILNFGKNEPISEYDTSDYIDTDKYKSKRNKLEREKNKEERKKSKLKSKVEVETQTEESTNMPYVRSLTVTIDEGTLSRYKTKILNDFGLIGVSGIQGVGTSGVVANMAEAYSILNKKVAVLDLNLDDRKQTVYFNEFEQGAKDTLSPLVKNPKSRTFTRNSVSDLIDVFSISRMVDETIDNYDIVNSFSEVITVLKESYDIVVADIPFQLLYLFNDEHALSFNSYLWVTENIPTAVEDLIVLKLRDLYSRNHYFIKELIHDSFIVFNKFVDDRPGYSDSPFDLTELGELLRTLPSPYNRVSVAGRLPYTSDWERQLYGQGLWVNYDADNERAILSILGKLRFK